MPAAHLVVEFADCAVFVFGEAAVFDVWPEIIQPPQTAAFAATPEAYTDVIEHLISTIITSNREIHYVKNIFYVTLENINTLVS